jgi:hypothetical protein
VAIPLCRLFERKVYRVGPIASCELTQIGGFTILDGFLTTSALALAAAPFFKVVIEFWLEYGLETDVLHPPRVKHRYWAARGYG